MVEINSSIRPRSRYTRSSMTLAPARRQSASAIGSRNTTPIFSKIYFDAASIRSTAASSITSQSGKLPTRPGSISKFGAVRSARLAERPPDLDAGFLSVSSMPVIPHHCSYRRHIFERHVCLLSLFIMLVSSELVIRREPDRRCVLRFCRMVPAIMMKGVGAAMILVYQPACVFIQRLGCGNLLE